MSKAMNAFETLVPRRPEGVSTLKLKPGQTLSQNGKVLSSVAPRVYAGIKYDYLAGREDKFQRLDRYRRIKGSSS